MEYIGFWEYDPEDLDKVRARWLKFGEVRDKNPSLFPKSKSKAYALFEGSAGFQIYEAENAQQLTGLMMYYHPYVEWRFIPIIELREAQEAFEKMQ